MTVGRMRDRLGLDRGIHCHPLACRLCRRLGAHGDAERLGRSEEHTSELQSLMRISYAVFCLKKKKHYRLSLVTKTRRCPNTNTDSSERKDRQKTKTHAQVTKIEY